MNSCPFCGAGEDEKPVDGRAMSPVVRGDFTECRACGARGPTVYWQDREPFTSRILRLRAALKEVLALDRSSVRKPTAGQLSFILRRHGIDPETLKEKW